VGAWFVFHGDSIGDEATVALPSFETPASGRLLRMRLYLMTKRKTSPKERVLA
jgi:hypothetical protein